MVVTALVWNGRFALFRLASFPHNQNNLVFYFVLPESITYSLFVSRFCPAIETYPLLLPPPSPSASILSPSLSSHPHPPPFASRSLPCPPRSRDLLISRLTLKLSEEGKSERRKERLSRGCRATRRVAILISLRHLSSPSHLTRTLRGYKSFCWWLGRLPE